MNPTQKTKMAKALVLCSLFVFTGLNHVVRAQDFPPPIEAHLIITSQDMVLIWKATENENVTGYKVYMPAGNQNIELGQTTDTSFSMPWPTFGYSITRGVSAVYATQSGESEILWTNQLILLLWEIPVNVNFEDYNVYVSGMACAINNGLSSWDVQDSVYHSGSHAASYFSGLPSTKASLYTTVISTNPEKETQLSFWAKVPLNNGLTDTLRAYYQFGNQWFPLGQPIHSLDEWHFFSHTIDANIYVDTRLKFVASSGAGRGVYLDDIVFEEKTVSIENPALNSDNLTLFPNPASLNATLICPSVESGNVWVKLYNSNGKLVKSIPEIDNSRLISGVELDLSDFPTGIYFVEVVGEQRRLTQTLVIRP
jgi:hypothetical protein